MNASTAGGQIADGNKHPKKCNEIREEQDTVVPPL